jgi:hypothetical protein
MSYDSDEDNYENEGNSKIVDNIFNMNIFVGDKLIIYFIDGMNYLGKVEDFTGNNMIILSVDDKKNELLKINDERQIILNTNEYNIIDIAKVEELEDKDIIKVTEIQLTKAIYPELEIDTEYQKNENYIISESEKREDLITTLINALNIYDNVLKIPSVYSMADIFKELISDEYNNIDNKFFYDIQKFNENEKLPNWIIPVCNDLKRLYLEPEEITEPLVQDDYIQKIFEKETLEKIRLMNNDNQKKTYKQIIDILYYNQFQAIQKNPDILVNDGYILKNYNKKYIRSCLGPLSGLNTSLCTGIEGKYILDERKNYNNLLFPHIIDNKIEFDIIGKCRDITTSGLLIYPENYHISNSFDLNTKFISLGEKCLLLEIKYSTKTNKQKLNELIKKNLLKNINTHIDKETPEYISKNYGYTNNNAYHYNISDVINKNDFTKLLLEYIPTTNKIIKNFMYKDIFNYIFNYNDIKKIFMKYNININNLTNSYKLIFNNIINKNVEKYIKLYDGYDREYKIYKKSLIKKKINTQQVIILLKEYIYKQLNINVKNHYMNKFIKKYSREPNEVNEDKNWLYNKFNDKKLLCKHHIYSSKTLEDPTAYETLMSKFSKPSLDGHIHCKICGEYLDNENFSTLQGFSDDNPVFNEELVQEREEIELEQDEKELYNLIELLTNSLGVKLIEKDILDLINIYNLIDHNLLANERYEQDNITTKNHFKIKNASKKDKKRIAKEVQEYIINSNKILFLFVTITIYIETATPPYVNESNNNYKILNLQDNKYKLIKNSNIDIINKTIVDNLISTLKKLEKLYPEDKLWIHSKEFNEEYNNVEITKPQNQFVNTIRYVVSPSFPQIYERINKYQIYSGISNNLDFNDYWENYKPLPTNKNIIEINDKINNIYGPKFKQFMIKKGSTYALQNISLLQSLDSYNTIKKYKELDIDNLELIDNNSFKRIYNYIFILTGYHKNDTKYMDLLINRLLETTNEKDYFKNLFKKYDWDGEFKDNTIPFVKLRKILDEIINVCKSNINCKKSLELYIHNKKNNSSYIFLNTYPKRYYKYTLREVLPNEEYDDLNKDSLIKNIFNKYCYDINKKIILKTNTEKKLVSLYVDNDNNYNACVDSIKPSNENFKTIIQKFHTQNRLKGIYFEEPLFNIDLTKETILNNEKANLIENRIIDFINSNNILNKGDEFLSYFQNIYEFTKYYINLYETTNLSEKDIKQFKSEYESLFTPIIESTYSESNDNNNLLNIVIRHIITSKYISKSQKDKLYKNESNLKNILIGIITNSFDDSGNLKINNNILNHFIQNIVLMLARIKNYNNNGKLGTTFYDYIPKNWNLSDKNREIMEYFIGNQEFKLHNSVFIGNDKYDGFKKYMDNKLLYSFFIKLFDNIKPYTNLLNILIGIDNKKHIFTEERATDLVRFIFVLIFKNIVEYIEELDKEINEINEDGNEIYNSLSAESSKNITDNIIEVSSFMMDIIINIIQEYNDPLWYINIENRGTDFLNTKLRQQKEREKQNLINKLDVMDQDERFINVQLQNFGISNWYQNLAEEASLFINSDEFKNMSEEERKEAEMELIKRNETELGQVDNNPQLQKDLLRQKPSEQGEMGGIGYGLEDYGYGEGDGEQEEIHFGNDYDSPDGQ